jgi:hypothetical protein
MTTMTIEELEQIETEESVTFKLKPGGRIRAKGRKPNAQRALSRIAAVRDEVAELLRERDGEVEEVVEIEVACNVPSLEIQKDNYRTWYSTRSGYFQPTEKELDKMFSVLSEGDEILPDFARSFSVRKPTGLLIQVDRRGRISPPSPYSPHLAQRKKEAE